MTRKTHICVGLAVTLPLLSVFPFYSILGMIGTTLADIDIKLGIKHRWSTHSLLALILATMGVMLINLNVGVIFGINYLIHLILDSCTVTGVPLLYPFNKKYYGPKLIKTGDSIDLFICLLAIVIIFI